MSFGNVPKITENLQALAGQLDTVAAEGNKAGSSLGKVKKELHSLGEGFSSPESDWSQNISHLSGDVPGLGHVEDTTTGVVDRGGVGTPKTEGYTPPQQSQADQLAQAQGSAG